MPVTEEMRSIFECALSSKNDTSPFQVLRSKWACDTRVIHVVFIHPCVSLIKEGADETIQKAQFAKKLIDYFRNTNSGEREKAYFEKMLDLKYENECLKREN